MSITHAPAESAPSHSRLCILWHKDDVEAIADCIMGRLVALGYLFEGGNSLWHPETGEQVIGAAALVAKHFRLASKAHPKRTDLPTPCALVAAIRARIDAGVMPCL